MMNHFDKIKISEMKYSSRDLFLLLVFLVMPLWQNYSISLHQNFLQCHYEKYLWSLAFVNGQWKGWEMLIERWAKKTLHWGLSNHNSAVRR